MVEPNATGPRVRRRVIVSGRVQGVWFRASCADEAVRLGVVGTVANRPDGTVDGDFEGTAAAVDALIAWCGHGPDTARVDDVAVADAPPIGYRDFRAL